MAKSEKEMNGWEIVFTDEGGNQINNDTRRSRRRGVQQNVHLKKQLDENIAIQIGRGSNIVLEDEESETGSVYLINEIRLNTMSNLVEVWTFKYMKWFDIEPESYYKQFNPSLIELNETEEFYNNKFASEIDKNEIYLSLQHVEIQLKDFISIPNIMDVSDWIDPSVEKIANKDFFLRYICTSNSEHFVAINLNAEIQASHNMKPKEAEEYFKDILYPQSLHEKENAKLGRKGQHKSEQSQNVKLNDYSSESDNDQIIDSDASLYESANDEAICLSEGEVLGSDQEGESESEIDENSDAEIVEAPKRRRGRPKKVCADGEEPLKRARKIKPPKQSTPVIRKFTKKNVVRAKKKYTPFSKKYKSIKDIPNLTNFGNFDKESNDLYLNELEDKLNTKTKHKIVETIFSKVKKQLYSSHGKEEIVKSSNFEDYLPARENEFASIYLSISSAIESSSATTVYIAGTPGVGKTLTVREVMKELQTSVKQDDLPNFQYLEINGLKMVKPTDAYEVLWNKISGEKLTWGAAMESLEFYFSKVPKNKKRQIVVLLDELDALVTKAQDIMYNFFNWTSYENAKLVVIAVANTMDLPERQLGNKVSSRIGFTRIMFTGYTHDELKSIIDLRLQGLNDSFFYVDTRTGSAYLVDDSMLNGTVPLPPGMKRVRLRMSSDAIEIASRKVASVSGDARRALKVCKRATEIAEQHYMAKHGYNYDGKLVVDEEDEEDLDESEKESDELGEYEVKVVTINHIMKALNETINTNVTKFISRSSFTTKLFIFAFLNLIKKSGVQEQPLGDVIDEIRLLIEVNGNNKFILSITNTLFQKGSENDPEQLRMISWDFIINKLIEAGILVKQNMKNERMSCVRFNISTDDIKNAIEQDKTLKDL